MRKFRIPHVFIFLSLLIVLCSILSYIIPSGKFERTKKTFGKIERTLVVPNSYQEVPKNISLKSIFIGEEVAGKSSPISIFGVFMAIPKGMSSAAELIFFVFFIGAVLAAVTNLLFADLALNANFTDKFLAITQLDDLFFAFDLDIRMARLTSVIFAENLAVGLASAASVAYLSSIVNKEYAAVQYALLVSLVMLLGV